MRRLFGTLFSAFALTLALPCFAFPPPGTLVLGEDPNSVSAGPNHRNRFVIYEVPAPGVSPITHMDLSWDLLERPVFWQNSAGITYFADVDRGYVKAVSSLTPRTGTLAPQPVPVGASNVSALARFGHSAVLVYDSVAQEAFSVELDPGKKSHRYNFAVPDHVFPSNTREIVDMDAALATLSGHTEAIAGFYLTDLGIVRHELVRDCTDPTKRPQILNDSTKFFPLFARTISLPMGGSLAIRRPLQMKRDGNRFWVMADAREDGNPITVLVSYRLDYTSAGRYSVEHVEDISAMQAPELVGIDEFQMHSVLWIRDGEDLARLEIATQSTWTNDAIILKSRVTVPSGLEVSHVQKITQSKLTEFPKVQFPPLAQTLINYSVPWTLPQNFASQGYPPVAGGYNFPPSAYPGHGSYNFHNVFGSQQGNGVLSQLLSQSIAQQNLSGGQEIVIDAVSTKVVEAPEVILKRRAELLVSLCWKRWRAGSGKVLAGIPDKAEGEIGSTAFAVFLNSMEADDIVGAFKTVDSHNTDLRAMGIDPAYPYAAAEFGGKVDISKLVALLVQAAPAKLPEDPDGDCDSIIIQ